MTIMGESAGSWSVSTHLVANNGDHEGLFRGAVGISGGPLKVDPPSRQQPMFDDMAQYVGCGDAADKIACLREAPYELLYAHMNTVNNFLLGFRSLASAWTVRPDGQFIADSPDQLVAAGKIANVPIMYGDMRDEGTLFSLTNQLNITTTELVKDYFKTYWWPNMTEAQLDRLMEEYPEDPTQGSPFGTGLLYAIPSQYKRLAAINGDYSFESQRRQLLAQHTAPKWNYQVEASLPLSDLGSTVLGDLVGGGGLGLTDIPVLGSFHAFDVFFNWFGTLPPELSLNSRHMMGVLVSFIHNLDPNQHGQEDLPEWPQWDAEHLATIRFSETEVDIIRDDYRNASIAFLNEMRDSMRL